MHHFRKLHDDVVEGRLGEIQMVRARAHFNCWSHVIDQILWTMGPPEWVSVMGNPNERGGWQRMIHMRWANGVMGSLDGTNLWGHDDHPLRVMIVALETYLSLIFFRVFQIVPDMGADGLEVLSHKLFSAV